MLGCVTIEGAIVPRTALTKERVDGAAMGCSRRPVAELPGDETRRARMRERVRVKVRMRDGVCEVVIEGWRTAPMLAALSSSLDAGRVRHRLAELGPPSFSSLLCYADVATG